MEDMFKEYYSSSNGRREELREELILANTGLVRLVVKEHRQRWFSVPYEDLIQIGTIGLIRAVDNFDPNIGTEFSTYAWPVILNEIRKSSKNYSGMCQVVHRRVYRVLNVIEELEETYGRKPTPEEIAEHLDMGLESIRNALAGIDFMRSKLSLDAPLNENNNGSLYDFLFDGTSVSGDEERVVLKAALERAMKKLGERERYLLEEYYFDRKNTEEIARETGVSRQRVHQVMTKSFGKLKRHLEPLLSAYYSC